MSSNKNENRNGGNNNNNDYTPNYDEIDLQSIHSVDDIKNKHHFNAILFNAFDSALPDVFENLEGCFRRFKLTDQFKNIKDIVKH